MDTVVKNEENSKCVHDIISEVEKELKESKEREKENKRKHKLVYLKETILSSKSKV